MKEAASSSETEAKI